MSAAHSSSSRGRAGRIRVAVVTGTRAEFGVLAPVVRAMRERAELDPKLIVTGMHLLRRFGRTIDHIRQAGFRVDATVRMQTERPAADQSPAVSRGIAGISRALDRLGCEIVVVLGDRIEAFAGACAATLGQRVLAHIHGGDRAVGTLDDQLRDAISRLAHIHLVASRDAAGRLRRMGEPAARIYRVGAPGLDDIREFRRRQRSRAGRAATDRWLAEVLGPLAGEAYAVVIQHPRGRSDQQEARTMRAVLSGVERSGLAGVVLYPNSDPGHAGILEVIGRLRGRSRWRVHRSLEREDYLRLVHRSAVLVGNSSSGIIESASIGVNVVNVGPRQAGRLRCGPNVLDVAEDSLAVVRGIGKASRRPRPGAGRSVYGDGRAGPRIAGLLAGLINGHALPAKCLTY